MIPGSYDKVAVPRRAGPKSRRRNLLVGLGGPEAETGAAAVAEMAAVAAFIGHTAAAVGGILGIAAADLPAVHFPQPINDETRAGQNGGAVRQMHSAQLLAGGMPPVGRAPMTDGRHVPGGILP